MIDSQSLYLSPGAIPGGSKHTAYRLKSRIGVIRLPKAQVNHAITHKIRAFPSVIVLQYEVWSERGEFEWAAIDQLLTYRHAF